MSASRDMLSGVQIQHQLRQIMVAVNAEVLNQSEIMIEQAITKFNEHGKFIDTNTQKFITKFILSFEMLTNQQQ